MLTTFVSIAQFAFANTHDVVLVCPPAFAESISPWMEYRNAQGFQIALVKETNRELIQKRIRDIANESEGNLRYVVLVGDTPLSPTDTSGIPASFVKAHVNVKWGSEPEIATDNQYADLDDDGIPDLAIGRLSAQTPEEVSRIVEKIKNYENQLPQGTWRRNVNFVAGVGGFGAIADKVIEQSAKSFITNRVPAAFKTSMTYASWRSPYCPDPRSFRDSTIEQINGGCLLWIYMGHGQRRSLDWIRVPAGIAPIFEEADYRKVHSRHGLPIAVFLSCYAGAYDDPHGCLAESVFRQAKGPVAVICGSRITMPYAMTVLSNNLLKEYFTKRTDRLGDVLFRAKRQLVAPGKDDRTRLMLDAIAKTISPDPEDLDGELREHIALFNLIGDPLLRIQHPQKIELNLPKTIGQSQTLNLQINSPVAGRCSVELVCRRGALTFQPEPRNQFIATDQGMRAMNDVYRSANKDHYSSASFDVTKENYQVRIPVSPGAKGPCQIRVFIAGQNQHAMGIADVFVRKKKDGS